MSEIVEKLDMAMTLVKSIDTKVGYTDRCEAVRLISECKAAAIAVIQENDTLRRYLSLFSKPRFRYLGAPARKLNRAKRKEFDAAMEKMGNL